MTNRDDSWAEDDDPFAEGISEFIPTDAEIRQAAKKLMVAREAAKLVKEREAEQLLSASGEQALNGVAFLEEVNQGEPVWGNGKRVAWARDQGFMVFGTDGTGKSTMLQQVVLARLGLRDPDVLGFPVTPDDRSVLYLALDRPAQIRESIARMVDLRSPSTYDTLKRRLTVIKGPVPFQCDENPRAFVEWCLKLAGGDCGLVIADSVKDMVSNCSDPVAGSGFNETAQLFISRGVEFGCAHHNRKENAQNSKPRNLADVYGSRFLTAGMGAVVNIWRTDDINRELTQLKSPYGEPFRPVPYLDDYARGTSQVSEDWRAKTTSALATARQSGLTDAELVLAVFGQTPKDRGYESDRLRITRQVKAWIKSGSRYERLEIDRDGKSCKAWRVASDDYPKAEPLQSVPSKALAKKHHARQLLAEIDSQLDELDRDG